MRLHQDAWACAIRRCNTKIGCAQSVPFCRLLVMSVNSDGEYTSVLWVSGVVIRYCASAFLTNAPTNWILRISRIHADCAFAVVLEADVESGLRQFHIVVFESHRIGMDFDAGQLAQLLDVAAITLML